MKHRFRFSSLRVLGLALLVGVCLWLLLDPSSRQNRRKLLNEIRARGGLPALSAQEAQELEAEFNAIARQIGTRDIIRINSPMVNGQLAVWITTPSSDLLELTGTDYGNAVYDATLDAVFIDRALVDPNDLFSVYSHSSYASVTSFNGAPFMRTLLHFVFAHELAHREKHRVSAGAFDSKWIWGWLPWFGTAARDREIEADRDAFDAIMLLYSHKEKRWASLFPRRSAPIYDIPVEELADARHAASLDIASAFLMASTAQFFTGTPFGGYHEDTAHPNIFARMNILLLNLTRSLPASDSPNGLDSLRSVVERLSRPPATPVAEIIAPWPIGMAGGSSTELRIVGVDSLKGIAIPWDSLRRRAQRREPEQAGARGRIEIQLIPPDLRTLASPDGFLYAFTEAGRERSLPQGFPLPQPGTYVASEPDRFGNSVQLEIMDAAGTRKCVASLIDPRRPDLGTPELGLGLATPRAIYTELLWLDGTRDAAKVADSRTWLRVDPRSCQSTLITYRVPRDVQSNWRKGLWSFIFIHGIERPVWVGPLSPESFSTGWGVWELGDDVGKAPLAEALSPYREKPGAPAWNRRFFEWQLAEVGPLSEDGIFVNVGNEGIFTVTFKGRGASVELLWPVGDEVFTVIPIANGAVIFFLKGGRKCYVAFPFEETV